MKLRTLEDLLVHELRDLYSAEVQLKAFLPELTRVVSHEDLKHVFVQHLEETEVHVERLEQIFEMLEKKPVGVTCKAMQGLIEEARELFDDEEIHEIVRDAALIGAAQQIEHHEIAGYGTARSVAGLIGYQEIVDLLTESLVEEKACDERLTELAMWAINVEAMEVPDPND